MKKIIAFTAAALLAAPLASVAGPPAKVTNGNDSGAGSLRAALASGANRIVIKPWVDTISITDTLVYASRTPLTIRGSGQVVDGTQLTGSDPILEITLGADLSLSRLTFQGQGGFDIANQGGGVGVLLNVPIDRTGVVDVNLNRVEVFDTGDHGILVNDCSVADCGGGSDGEGDGSDASIHARLVNVLIDGAGFGKQDGDGFRANERGLGDIVFEVTRSEFRNVGGDGVELDENQEGEVLINVRNSVFDDNGAYCYDGGDLSTEDVFLLDPNCNDDNEADVDDAFDIDEGGPGGIKGRVRNIDLRRNFDEGLDFDTAGAGDADGVATKLSFVNILAEDNDGDGIKVSVEDGTGDAFVRLARIETNNEIQIEEDGPGSMHVRVSRVTVDDEQLKIEEKGAGDVYTRITASTATDAIEIVEEDDGDLAAKISGSTIDTLEMEQAGDGTGTVKIRGSDVDTLDLTGVSEI